jgi:hypothetical protein
MLESESRSAENVVAPMFRMATGKRYYDSFSITSTCAGANSGVLINLGPSFQDGIILVQKTLCKDFKSKTRKMLQSLKSSVPDAELPSACPTCCTSKSRRTSDEICAFKCTCRSNAAWNTLNYRLVLRGISAHGHVVFAHFAEIPAPIYDKIFTLSNFEPITSNARLALMVILKSSLRPSCQLTIIVHRLGLFPFFCRSYKSNFSTYACIRTEYSIESVNCLGGKYAVGHPVKVHFDT